MPPYPPEHILNCARMIRACLHELLNEKDANQMEAALADLLTNPLLEGNVIDLIRAQLSQYAKTRAWTRNYIEWAATTVDGVQRGFDPLPGIHIPPSAPQYACPKCRSPWARRVKGQPSKQCTLGCRVTYEPVVAVYICPKGDLIWPIFDKETPPPQCQTHKLSLLLVQ